MKKEILITNKQSKKLLISEQGGGAFRDAYSAAKFISIVLLSIVTCVAGSVIIEKVVDAFRLYSN